MFNVIVTKNLHRQMMQRVEIKLFMFWLLAALFITFLPSHSFAQQGTLTDDANYPQRNKPAAVETLSIEGGSGIITFIRFKVTPNLPSATPGSQVAKAVLKLYAKDVANAGSFNVYRVTSSWKENDPGPPAYDATAAVAENVPVSKADSFINIDLTQLVQQWLGTDGSGVGGLPNYGIALVANGNGDIGFDSKESETTSHAPQLDLILNHAATADQATNADKATTADYATSADTATAVSGPVNAGQVIGALTNATISGTNVNGKVADATNATNAVNATNATNAVNATTADSARTVSVPLVLNGTVNGIVRATTTTSNTAIIGASDSGTAINGVSNSGNAVVGTSTSSAGVNGNSTDAFGVWGVSTNNTGVLGTGGFYGVDGASGNNNGAGVHGVATGDSTGSGVLGEARNGKGVAGLTSSSTGIGVYGKNLLGGDAGRFDGNVTVNGNLSVTGTTNATATNANHANTADSATSVTGTVNASQINGKVASAGTADTAGSVTGNVEASKITGALTNATIDGGKITGDLNLPGNATIGGTLNANAINTGVQYNIGGSRVLSMAGPNNIFVGPSAGANNTTGAHNSFAGALAGNKNTIGNYNSFFGAFAGAANTEGGANSFYGYRAGTSNTNGNYNSIFGIDAGYGNTTGSSNAFFGYVAGSGNSTGNNNAFFGSVAGSANTTGSYNSFFGTEAGRSTTTGSNNVSFGQSAGFFNTTGSGNTFFGRDAGLSNTTENDNTFIGKSSNGLAGTTNATSIGAGATVTQSNSLVLGNNAKVGIGTPAPQAKLHVVSNGSAGQFDGNVTINGNLNVSGTGSMTVTHANTADSATSVTGTVDANQINGKVASAGTADTANTLAATATIPAHQISGDLSNATINATKLTGKISVDASSGNVGIGTTTPGTLLHLHTAAGANPSLTLSDADSPTPSFSSVPFAPPVAPNTIGRLNVVNSGSGGLAIQGFSSSSVVQGLLLEGYSAASPSVAAVNFDGYKHSGGTGRTSLNASEIVAKFRNGGSQDLLTILGNGNVGIGLVSPPSKLTVAGTVESTAGGIKFPDGTTQTTAATSGLPSVVTNNSLTGNGTSRSPLAIASVDGSLVTGKVLSANTADTANALAPTASVAGSQIDGKVSSAATADTATSVNGSVNANQVVGALTNSTLDASRLTGSITVDSSTGNAGVGSSPFLGIKLVVNGGSTGTGVWGRSGSSFGVRGESDTATGTQGRSISGNGTVGFSSSGNGILGSSNTGNGVSGQSLSSTAAGVYGKNSSGGPAGMFDGNVQINGTLTVSGQINGANNSGLPPGMMMAFGGPVANVPAGWKLCDGTAIDRTTYAALFAAIGTSWGAGDGSTTFNLPDLRGTFLRGVDAGAGVDPNASSRTASSTGGNTGDAVGTIQIDATRRPNNDFLSSTDGLHNHNDGSYNLLLKHDGTNTAAGGLDNISHGFQPNLSVPGAILSAGNHSHAITGGGDNETRPKNAGVYWIIRVQ